MTAPTPIRTPYEKLTDEERDQLHEWCRLHSVVPNHTPTDALIEYDPTFDEWRIEQYGTRDGRICLGEDGEVRRVILRRRRKAPLPWPQQDRAGAARVIV